MVVKFYDVGVVEQIHDSDLCFDMFQKFRIVDGFFLDFLNGISFSILFMSSLPY